MLYSPHGRSFIDCFHTCIVLKNLVNGPAYKAGMKTDDLIVAVNGVKTSGMTIRQVVDLFAAKKARRVTIDVRQPDTQEVRSLKMMRGVVPLRPWSAIDGPRRTVEFPGRCRDADRLPADQIADQQCRS